MKRWVFAVLICALVAQSGRANAQNTPVPAQVVGVRLPGRSVSMPSAIDRTLPPVPEARAGAAASGEVRVEIVVAADGTVADARVRKSLEPSIDEACRAAAKHWTFRPAADSGGRPVATLVLVKFEFAAPQSTDRPGNVTATLTSVPDASDIADGASVLASTATPGPSLLAPKLVRSVSPSYTENAMRALIQGDVTLNVLVLADGTVGFASVAKSLDGQFGLDDEAVRVVHHWLFVPASLGGQPVASRVTIIMSFKLH